MLCLAAALLVGNTDALGRAGADPEPSLVTRIVPVSPTAKKKAFRFLIGIKNPGKNVSRLIVGLNRVVKGYSYPTGPSSGAGSASGRGSVDGPQWLRPPIDGEQYCETNGSRRDFIVGIPSGGEIFLMGKLNLSEVPDGRYPLEVRVEIVTLADSTGDCAEVRYESSKASIPIVINGETLRTAKQD